MRRLFAPGRRRVLALALALCAIVPVAAHAAMPTLSFTKSIDGLAPYVAQSTCDPTPKPGAVALRDMILRAYPGTVSSGIGRACSIGGRSEHKEGRAFDWGVNYYNTTQRAQAANFLYWLLKSDQHGNRYAHARRLGVMYVIWNHRIWTASRASDGWRAYDGASPHTDHVHISLSWAGAYRKTSWWTQQPIVYPTGTPKPTPTTPKPTPTSTPKPVSYPAEPRPLAQPVPAPTGAKLLDEQLAVPASSSRGVVSKGILQRGKSYVLEVRGTYRYGRGRADAECSAPTTAPSSWERERSTDPTRPLADSLDLYINGVDIIGTPAEEPIEGCDSRNHSYRYLFTAPTTDRARLKIWDSAYGDNSGNLYVRIRESGPITAPFVVPVSSSRRVNAASRLYVQEGHDYIVEMTGTFSYGAGKADAECATGPSGDDWRRDREVTGGTGSDKDLSLLLSGSDPRGRVDRVDGERRRPECSSTHTYRAYWVARRTENVLPSILDGTYGDNVGALRVTITPVA